MGEPSIRSNAKESVLSPFFLLVMDKDLNVEDVNEDLGTLRATELKGANYLEVLRGSNIGAKAHQAALSAKANKGKTQEWGIDICLGSKVVRFYEEMVYIDIDGFHDLVLNVGCLDFEYKSVTGLPPAGVARNRLDLVRKHEYYTDLAKFRGALGVRFEAYIFLHGECVYSNTGNPLMDESYHEALLTRGAGGGITRWESQELSDGCLVWHNELCFKEQWMVIVRSPVARIR